MAQKGELELFQVGDSVTWRQDIEYNEEMLRIRMTNLSGLKVKEVTENTDDNAQDRQWTWHPQTVWVELADGKDHPFSGHWFIKTATIH